MGSKVDLIEEIRLRLYTAIGSGKTLEGVKRVRVGSIEEARKDTDLPIINIRLLGGSEAEDHPNLTIYDNMNIEISLIEAKLAEPLNTLYKTSDSTGALFLFEKMLNALDNNTSDVPDNTFSSNAHALKTINYNVYEENDVVAIVANVVIRGKNVTVGGR